MIDQLRIYLFRQSGTVRSGDTVIAAARDDFVIAKFGAGGNWGEAGLVRAFGGAVVLKNDETGVCFLGVWRKRNAARFRATLSEGKPALIIQEPPPARMMCRIG